MRSATITLAVLGLLFVGTTFVSAQQLPLPVPAAPYVTTAANVVVVTPTQQYGYQPAPEWYRDYYRYAPYDTYGPNVYRHGVPRYYEYHAQPYSGYYYYYPNGVGFEYPRPSRSFGYGF